MTLDEAIQHLTETLSNSNHNWSCDECKQEHEQLLDWLLELKYLRSLINSYNNFMNEKELD